MTLQQMVSTASDIKSWRIVFSGQDSQETLREIISSITNRDISSDIFVELKSSDNARVRKFSVRGESYIVKEYLKRGALEYLKACIAGSRARKAWESGLSLMARGIGTPAVRAYGEKIFFCIPTRNFLITDFLPDACGIHTFFRSSPSNPADRNAVLKKRAVIRALGLFIGSIHAQGIFHGDLRLDNILISPSGEKGHAFFLIDNERNRFFPGGIPDRYREKNLIQVNMVVLPQITASDRLRFFHAYLEKNPALRPAMKIWYRAVFSATKQRLMKKFPGVWEKQK